MSDSYFFANSTFEWWPTARIQQSRGLVREPRSGSICLNNFGLKQSLYRDESGTCDGRTRIGNPQWNLESDNFHINGVLLQDHDRIKKMLTGPASTIFCHTQLGAVTGLYPCRRNDGYHVLTAEDSTEFHYAIKMERSPCIGSPFEVRPSNPLHTGNGPLTASLQRDSNASGVGTAQVALPELLNSSIFPATQVARPADILAAPWQADSRFDHFNAQTLGPQWNSLRVCVDPSWPSFSESPHPNGAVRFAPDQSRIQLQSSGAHASDPWQFTGGPLAVRHLSDETRCHEINGTFYRFGFTGNAIGFACLDLAGTPPYADFDFFHCATLET